MFRQLPEFFGYSSLHGENKTCSYIDSTSSKQTMIHTKDKDVVTRTEALMLAFGWQGGTIHQVAEVTGCDAHGLIYGESIEYNASNKAGWFAYRTNSLEFNQQNITEKHQGDLQFWLGVAAGVQTSIKMKQPTPKKF